LYELESAIAYSGLTRDLVTVASTTTTATTTAATATTTTPPAAAAVATTATAIAATTVAAATATAVAAATVAATATTIATTATATTVLARACLVHNKVPVEERLAVHCFYGRFSLGLRGHFDKRETPRASAEFVRHDIDRRHFTERGKRLIQILLGRLVREVANINPH
jgi:hypothetical protein